MSLSLSSTASNALAADASSLNQLKLQAGQATPESIRETAKQFESLFMRELIKSMREATMKSGMLDNPGSDLGTDLLDQQFAVQMSGKPGGLSDLIAAQLSRQMGVASPSASIGASTSPTKPTGSSGARGANGTSGSISSLQKAASLAAYSPNSVKPSASQSGFVAQHSDSAARIAQETGIPASFMIGQAGHETGWGKFEIKKADGQPAYNLFGIKAGPGWKGQTAEVVTTEYVGGVAQKKVAKFRAYDSYDDSFRDYARLITQSPRYAKVTEQTGSAQAFAASLQKAGYATDPNYAAKLSRAIETTQRLQQRSPVVASVWAY
jgi:flagellar protein FlgJ